MESSTSTPTNDIDDSTKNVNPIQSGTMECAPSTSTSPVFVQEFLSTGRTGRRNALGDILDEKTAYITTAGLSDQLEAMSFGADGCAPSTSGMNVSTTSASSSSPTGTSGSIGPNS